VTSPEARRDPVRDDQVRTMGDAGRVAKDRLESGLYTRRVGTAEAALADAALSCAASLMRIGGMPRRDGVVQDDSGALLAALIAENAALKDSLRDLRGRVEALEDRP